MAVIDRPIELEEPEVMDEIDQDLLRAEHYLEEHGWCRRPMLRTGEVCLGNAVIRTSGVNHEAFRRIRKVIDCPSIGLWNDYKCQSKEEAIAILRKAREHK